MTKLKAEERKRTAKQNKKLRQEDLIPAVIYGPNRKSTNIKVNLQDFEKFFEDVGYSKIIDIEIGGKTTKALVREVQYDAMGDSMMHVSFYELDLKKKITVDVPVESEGTSKAVSENIGFLVLPFETFTVHCLPTKLPEKIIVDVNDLNEVGDNILLRDLELPEGVELDVSYDKNAAIAYISPPQKEIVEEEEVVEELEEGEEGELAEGEEGEVAEGAEPSTGSGQDGEGVREEGAAASSEKGEEKKES